MLAYILPSASYARNNKSIDGLHEAIAKDVTTLFREGLRVKAGVGRISYGLEVI